jgi:hypothetical protein
MAQLLTGYPTIAKLDSAKKISKELATRQKEFGKDAKAEVLALRKAIKAEIDRIDDIIMFEKLLAELQSY